MTPCENISADESLTVEAPAPAPAAASAAAPAPAPAPAPAAAPAPAPACAAAEEERPHPTRRVIERRIITLQDAWKLFMPVGAMLLALGLSQGLPTIYPEGYQMHYYPMFLWVCFALWMVFAIIGCFVPKVRHKMMSWSYLVLALFLLLELLDILTLKTGIMRLPFAPSPDRVLTALPANLDTYWVNFCESAKLYVEGIALGLVTGFLTGMLMGWSKIANYWFTPLLKFLGPIPSVAWLPMAVIAMPTTHLAGVLLIAVAVWFPLALMLSGSIRSTDTRKIDAARVMGASEWYILIHVALPASVPAIFDALFMGFSSSFGALIVSEELGVKAGLGWYISWAEAWGEYYKVFATVGLFIIIFYIIMNVLFKVRDHVMTWQESVVRW